MWNLAEFFKKWKQKQGKEKKENRKLLQRLLISACRAVQFPQYYSCPLQLAGQMPARLANLINLLCQLTQALIQRQDLVLSSFLRCRCTACRVAPSSQTHGAGRQEKNNKLIKSLLPDFSPPHTLISATVAQRLSSKDPSPT